MSTCYLLIFLSIPVWVCINTLTLTAWVRLGTHGHAWSRMGTHGYRTLRRSLSVSVYLSSCIFLSLYIYLSSCIYLGGERAEGYGGARELLEARARGIEAAPIRLVVVCVRHEVAAGLGQAEPPRAQLAQQRAEVTRGGRPCEVHRAAWVEVADELLPSSVRPLGLVKVTSR